MQLLLTSSYESREGEVTVTSDSYALLETFFATSRKESRHVTTGVQLLGVYWEMGACSAPRTVGGNLSVFAKRSETCHICSLLNEPVNPGIPVKRMPFATFQ